MARWPFNFMPRPGRFGNSVEIVQSVPIGTGGANATANTTTDYTVGTPASLCYVENIRAQAVAAGNDADGTILVQVFKRDVSAGQNVALTAGTFSLESDGITAGNRQFTIPITGSDIARTVNVQNGDALFVRVTNNSAAIDTQPNQAVVSVELSVLR